MVKVERLANSRLRKANLSSQTQLQMSTFSLNLVKWLLNLFQSWIHLLDVLVSKKGLGVTKSEDVTENIDVMGLFFCYCTCYSIA